MSPTNITTLVQSIACYTLQQRRLRTRLIFFYKITHNLVAIYPSNLLFPMDSRTRHHNPHSFQHIRCNKDTYKFSFYPQTVIQWNLLPSMLHLQIRFSCLQRTAVNAYSSGNLLLNTARHVYSFNFCIIGFLSPPPAQVKGT